MLNKSREHLKVKKTLECINQKKMNEVMYVYVKLLFS